MATHTLHLIYAGQDYYRTRDGAWFYMNRHREPYFLNPDDAVDADTIAILNRHADKD